MKKSDCCLCLVRKSFKILPVPSGILLHWFYPILPHEIYQFLGDVEIWQSFQRIHIWNSWLISPILAMKCTSNELPWCVVVFALIRDNLGSIFHHEIHPFLIENQSKPWQNSNFWALAKRWLFLRSNLDPSAIFFKILNAQINHKTARLILAPHLKNFVDWLSQNPSLKLGKIFSNFFPELFTFSAFSEQ